MSRKVAPPVDAAMERGSPVPIGEGRRWKTALWAMTVVAVWVGVVRLATEITPVPAQRQWALIGHLICLALSFGAVLVVELHGFGFLLRLVSRERMATVALSLDPPIWAGLLGMCATGLLLGPQMDRPLTLVKLFAVLLVALNGVRARELAFELRRPRGSDDRSNLPTRFLRRAVVTSALSQLGWWSAFGIGFFTTNG
jgi:hypothetical protein